MPDYYCCLKAVFDDVAGWWCPDHGDEMQERIDAARKASKEDDA